MNTEHTLPLLGWLVSGGVLSTLLIALAVVDARRMIIPDRINLAILFTGTAHALVLRLEHAVEVATVVVASGGALYAFRAVYFRLRGSIGLGLGDVKLVGASAPWLGPQFMSRMLLIACGSALLWLGWRRFRGDSITRTDRFPFGPFLAFAIVATWVLRLWLDPPPGAL